MRYKEKKIKPLKKKAFVETLKETLLFLSLLLSFDVKKHVLGKYFTIMSDHYQSSSNTSSSSTSSSESEEENFDDIKDLCDNFAKLKPYDFEPLASTDESEDEEQSDNYNTDKDNSKKTNIKLIFSPTS